MLALGGVYAVGLSLKSAGAAPVRQHFARGETLRITLFFWIKIKMARARNIKPSIFRNELLGTLDPMVTILFTSLWCLADRDGKMEDRPLRIKADTFPYRENVDINRYLTELAHFGFIRRYTINGQSIIQVVKFKEHQSPHKTERDSVLPDFDSQAIENKQEYILTDIAPLSNDGLTAALPPESISLNPSSLIPESISLIPDGVAKAPRPAKKCPDDFLVTQALQTWAAKECPNADVQAETAKFRDHTFSTARTDWAGTWRNWLRKSQESKPFYGKSVGSHTAYEPPYAKYMREKMEQISPLIAAKNPNAPKKINPNDFINGKGISDHERIDPPRIAIVG